LKTHHIILLIWFVVFAMWLAKQFSDYNKRRDD
jgi:hypothetical protein